MKDPYDVLRKKEQELVRVRQELDALRIAIRLIGSKGPKAEDGEDRPKLHRVIEMP